MTTRITCSAIAITLWASALIYAQARERDASWIAPAKAAAKVNPIANQPALVEGGGRLFAEHCAECHGEDAQGTEKAPDLTQPDVQAQTDGELFWKISTGNARAGMPTFSFLPSAQRWQLVLKLRASGSS